MADKWWKALERRIAEFFGTQRTALSGGNSKLTSSDSLHDALYIEVKGRKQHSVVTLWRDTYEKARREGKIPVVCLAEKGRHGFYILCRADHLERVAKYVDNSSDSLSIDSTAADRSERDIPAIHS